MLLNTILYLTYSKMFCSLFHISQYPWIQTFTCSGGWNLNRIHVKTRFVYTGWEVITIRGIICYFSKFFAPDLFFCTQFCVRTRSNLLLSRSQFAPGPCLFPSLCILIMYMYVQKQHFEKNGFNLIIKSENQVKLEKLVKSSLGLWC